METLRTRSRSKDKRRVHCILCDRTFSARGPFERICKRCKEDSELYRFSNWLPDSEAYPIEELDPAEFKSTG